MEEFGSKKISNSTATPYSDATQTKKQPRDKIKRPMNAFMVWSQMQRRKLASTVSTHHAEVSKKLGMLWKSMSDDDKKPYFEESARLQELHLREFPDYKYKPKKKQTGGRRASADLTKVSETSKQIRRRRKSAHCITFSTKNANVRPQLASQYSPDSPVSDITDTLDSEYIISACDVEEGSRSSQVCRNSESSLVFSFERTLSPDMMTPAATPSPCPSPDDIWSSEASPIPSVDAPDSYQASQKTPSNTGVLNLYRNTPNTSESFCDISENSKIEFNISSHQPVSTFTCLDSSFYSQNSLDPAVQEIKIEDTTQFDEVYPVSDSIEGLMATINSQLNEEQFETIRNLISSTDLVNINSFESVEPTIPTETTPTAQAVETSYFRRTERQNDPFLTSAFL